MHGKDCTFPMKVDPDTIHTGVRRVAVASAPAHWCCFQPAVMLFVYYFTPTTCYMVLPTIKLPFYAHTYAHIYSYLFNARTHTRATPVPVPVHVLVYTPVGIAILYETARAKRKEFSDSPRLVCTNVLFEVLVFSYTALHSHSLPLTSTRVHNPLWEGKIKRS